VKNFTGIDSPYEAPESPEVRIATVGSTPEEGVRRILEKLR
jgi:bifunctional enzyme CysN/CysC